MEEPAFGGNLREEEALEELLRFLQPDESAVELFGRVKANIPLTSGLPALDSSFKLRPRSVLEVYGPGGSGKSAVLLSYVATCVMPEEHRGICYGGQGSCVIFLDLDCKFDIGRLKGLLLHRIQLVRSQLGLGHDQIDTQEILASSLQRFQLCSCTSTFQLLVSLKVIEPVISDLHRQCGEKSLGLLVIDNIGAYYWLDRAARHLPKGTFEKEPPAKSSALGLYDVFEGVCSQICLLLRRHRIPLVVSKCQIFADDPSHAFTQHKEYLPAPWQKLVTHRVLLKEDSGIERNEFRGQGLFYLKWDAPHKDCVHLLDTLVL